MYGRTNSVGTYEFTAEDVVAEDWEIAPKWYDCEMGRLARVITDAEKTIAEYAKLRGELSE